MRLVLIGVAAGFFSALFGVGGGIVTVPLLVLVAGFEQRQATATSLAAIGVTALAGTVLQQRLRRREISFLFSALLVVVAIRLLLQ